MAIRARSRGTIAPQLEVSVHWAAHEPPVVARLDLAEARELVDRLSLADPDDAGVAEAMTGDHPARLLLGLQAFYRIVLERDGCVALGDAEGRLWTIPARSVNAVTVQLTAGVVRSTTAPDPVSLQRAFASPEDRAGTH